MIERIIYSWPLEVKMLMGISVLFGVIVGGVAVIAVILLMQHTPKEETEKAPCRRLLSPRQHRKESEDRAAKIALVKVAGLAVEQPIRR